MKHLHLICSVLFFAVGLSSFVRARGVEPYGNEAIYHQVTFLGNMILALMALSRWKDRNK